MDAKHPKGDTLCWTAEALYKLIGNGKDRRAAGDAVSDPDGDGPDDGQAVAFGSSLAAPAPDALAGGVAFFGNEGDDPLFGDGDGDYLFSGVNDLRSGGGIGVGGLYGGDGDGVIVYNPSNAADGGEDVDFLLVKESGGVNISDFRATGAEDEGTPNAEVIIYGEDVAGLTSLKALADIGITVDDGRISVEDHDVWMWGVGDARGEYTTFTGSDNEGNKLTVEVLTADLKKIGAAG
ncbi:MAG: hypothetical protein LBR94_10130 [Desulfovibrio sp.]|jgi:hypothetical protein|nr:hypothetical protein [Desulfovibrio sp.]